jgi:hypothetical protein
MAKYKGGQTSTAGQTVKNPGGTKATKAQQTDQGYSEKMAPIDTTPNIMPQCPEKDDPTPGY